MAQPELIIFDCDGVLVDSEPLANAVLAAYLTELGFPVSAADCMGFVGLSLSSVRDQVEREASIILPGDFLDEIMRRDRIAFAGRLQPISGILETLDALPYKKCVASSGAPEKIEHSLTITGLIDAFRPHLFSATQVTNGKPAPDLFLHAAREMKTRPDHAVVIEDSLAGAEAGRRAGMTVFGFCGGGHITPGHDKRLRAVGADVTFDRMSDLPRLIAGL